MVKKVQIYAEKVASRYDPTAIQCWGHPPLPPKHSQKLASME